MMKTKKTLLLLRRPNKIVIKLMGVFDFILEMAAFLWFYMDAEKLTELNAKLTLSFLKIFLLAKHFVHFLLIKMLG